MEVVSKTIKKRENISELHLELRKQNICPSCRNKNVRVRQTAKEYTFNCHSCGYEYMEE